jgi:N-methylhydantoinase B
VKGAINSTLSFTKAATFTCVKSVLPAGIPNNEGFFRAIEVIAPPGTITNCVLPAACAARGLTGFRMVDACFGALAQMLPDRVPAASDGGATGVSIGGYHADRTPFIQVDFLMSAWGARPWADGLDGNAHMFGNLSSQPAEVCEIDHPVEILRFEFIQDAGGPGRYRGGMSLRRDYRLLEAEATLQVRADRHAIRPYGLYGGRPGRAAQNYLIGPDGAVRPLPAKVTMTMKRGEVFRHEQAGPGGWGDPLERDPARVLRDVRNELVSLASARDDYGVVIDPATGTVDVSATADRRARLRDRARASRPPSA